MAASFSGLLFQPLLGAQLTQEVTQTIDNIKTDHLKADGKLVGESAAISS